MIHTLRGLKLTTADQVIQVFSKIPDGVTSLIFGNNNLDKIKITGAELAQAFALIKASVTSLDLSGNGLGINIRTNFTIQHDGENSGIIHEEAHNGLGIKTETELAIALSGIPTNVTSVNLGSSLLDEMSGEALVKVLAVFRDKVTSLSFEDNFLGFQTNEKLAQIFKGIPASVTILDLKNNDLGTQKADKLIKAFAAIPETVTSLNLSHNYFSELSGTELKDVFAAIPARVVIINLASNEFALSYNDTKSRAKLTEVFATLPAGVTTLNLSANYLFEKSGRELAIAFAAVPTRLASLDLSGNELSNKSHAELVEAFSGIPANIKILYLSDSDMINRSSEEIKVLGESLPHVMKIGFRDQDGHLISERRLDRERLLQYGVRFDAQLKILEHKANELKKRDCHRAYEVANTLYMAFSKLKEDYCSTKMEYSLFKTEATKAIDAARVELKKHRGWKEVFINLAAFIAGLGVGYLVLCAYRGSFFKYDTDSVIKLRDFQNSINATVPGMEM